MEGIIEKFKKLSTCNISDALDKLKLKSGIIGIRPAYDCKTQQLEKLNLNRIWGWMP